MLLVGGLILLSSLRSLCGSSAGYAGWRQLPVATRRLIPGRAD